MTATVASAVPAGRVREILARNMRTDGFDLVLDLRRSHGTTLVDERDGTREHGRAQ